MNVQDIAECSEISNLVAQFSKIKYTHDLSVSLNIQDAILKIFSDHINFDSLKANSGEPLPVMNFKKILIRNGCNVDVFCTHQSMRRVLRFLPTIENFGGLNNLSELDLVTLMKQKPVLILIYGTSGSGKSTMSKRLATKYGISNVLSTDTVRKKMREKVSKTENPLLHASTFETGDFLSQADYDRIYA